MLKELQQQIADGLQATTANGRKELKTKALAKANNPAERELLERMYLIDQAATAYRGNSPSVDALVIAAVLLGRGK